MTNKTFQFDLTVLCTAKLVIPTFAIISRILFCPLD